MLGRNCIKRTRRMGLAHETGQRVMLNDYPGALNLSCSSIFYYFFFIRNNWLLVYKCGLFFDQNFYCAMHKKSLIWDRCVRIIQTVASDLSS